VIHALPIAILTLPLVSFSAIAQSNFGRSGDDGNRGRDGRNGRDGQDIKIVSDGKPAAYNLTGTIGEDAEDGTVGRSASSCDQPRRTQFSLIGASGGSGGVGGVMDAVLSGEKVVTAKRVLGQLPHALQKSSADLLKSQTLLGNITLESREFAQHQAIILGKIFYLAS